MAFTPVKVWWFKCESMLGYPFLIENKLLCLLFSGTRNKEYVVKALTVQRLSEIVSCKSSPEKKDSSSDDPG